MPEAVFGLGSSLAASRLRLSNSLRQMSDRCPAIVGYSGNSSSKISLPAVARVNHLPMSVFDSHGL